MSEVAPTRAKPTRDYPSTHTAEGQTALSTAQREHFDRLAKQPEYRHFVRIPIRIARCLDYFGVKADHPAVGQTLLAYYLFIGVVDHAVDSGDAMTATTVFDRLATLAVDTAGTADVELVTEGLKAHLDQTVQAIVIEKLHDLYARVVEERTADSIESYLETRKQVGRLTAELSYLLIRPLLDNDRAELQAFMEEVGAVGCLVDSVIDARVDRRRGLLSFEPGLTSRLKLWLATLSGGLSLVFAHPKLIGLFVQAIADNVRDRFNRNDAPNPIIPNRIGSEVARVG